VKFSESLKSKCKIIGNYSAARSPSANLLLVFTLIFMIHYDFLCLEVFLAENFSIAYTTYSFSES